MPTWAEISLAILSLLSTGGFFTVLWTLNAKKRQENAAAGQSELALKRAEIEIEQIQDEYSRNAISAAFEQLNSVQEAFRQHREQAREREQYLSEELAKVTTQLIDMTREKLIAEKKYKSSRCDNWDCMKRIPPFE